MFPFSANARNTIRSVGLPEVNEGDRSVVLRNEKMFTVKENFFFEESVSLLEVVGAKN